MALSVAQCSLCVLLCLFSLQTVAMAGTLNFTVYTNEVRGGPNATVLVAAGTGQGNSSAQGWGSFLVVDNLVKEGESVDSTTLGRFTGTGAITTIGGVATGGVQVVSKFGFDEVSKYNGSNLHIVGTVGHGSPPWELVVVGGTGYFRTFWGYALLQPVANAPAPPVYASKWDFFLTT